MTRGADGELATFANICRHRGHELLACGATSDRRVVQCPYHAWTLRARRPAPPGAARRRDGQRRGRRARPAARAHRAVGWLVVRQRRRRRASRSPSTSATSPCSLAPWRTADLRIGATHHYELAANWKVAIENYHECGHCPLIHPELCQVSPADSGINVRAQRGVRRRGDAPGRRGGDDEPRRPAPHCLHCPASTTNDDVRCSTSSCSPTCCSASHPDYVMTHRIEAADADRRRRIECQWLFAADAVADPAFDPSFAVDFWDLTNRQDWAAVESVQRGIDSCRFEPGVFTANEDAVYHFATMLAAGLPGRRTPTGEDRDEPPGRRCRPPPPLSLGSTSAGQPQHRPCRHARPAWPRAAMQRTSATPAARSAWRAACERAAGRDDVVDQQHPQPAPRGAGTERRPDEPRRPPLTRLRAAVGAVQQPPARHPELTADGPGEELGLVEPSLGGARRAGGRPGDQVVRVGQPGAGGRSARPAAGRRRGGCGTSARGRSSGRRRRTASPRARRAR